MALIRLIADGEETPCHKCGREFRPGTMKVKRPSRKPNARGAFSEGGKAYVWVHDTCAPTKASYHGQAKVRR